MLVPSAAFQLDSETSTEALLASLASLLPCRHVDRGLRRSVIYDTCDARLRRAGHLLWTESLSGPARLHVRLRGSVAEQRIELPPGAEPDFAWNLPDSVRAAVTDAAGARRLVRVLEIERSERGLDVLDDQGKVVARVRVPEGRARPAGATEWGPLAPVLTVDGVRGYAEAHRDLLALLATRPGLAPAPGNPTSLEGLCAALPQQPPPPLPGLRPDMRADAGLQQILRVQLDTIEANERGVREDSDTEFLHDFRVAVRRTRSLLRQFRGVLPARLVAHLRAEFAWLGRASNAVRDLDVFRLWLRGQPEDPALAPVLELLEDRRRAALGVLLADLDSPRYRALIDGWRELLGRPPEALTPDGRQPPRRAGQPLAEVVARRVWRTWRRVVDAAQGIDAVSPAPVLHALRIRCKQLRYVLDATAPIHDARLLGRVIECLKRLQTALGGCNDASMQRALLGEFASELGRRPGSAEALLAVGRLQARLDQRERRARLELSALVERLASDRMRATFRQLARRRVDGAA